MESAAVKDQSNISNRNLDLKSYIVRVTHPRFPTNSSVTSLHLTKGGWVRLCGVTDLFVDRELHARVTSLLHGWSARWTF